MTVSPGEDAVRGLRRHTPRKVKRQNRRVGISTYVQKTTCLSALFSLAFSFTPLTVWALEKRCVVSQAGETTARAFRRDPRAGAILDVTDTSYKHMQALMLQLSSNVICFCRARPWSVNRLKNRLHRCRTVSCLSNLIFVRHQTPQGHVTKIW